MAILGKSLTFCKKWCFWDPPEISRKFPEKIRVFWTPSFPWNRLNSYPAVRNCTGRSFFSKSWTTRFSKPLQCVFLDKMVANYFKKGLFWPILARSQGFFCNGLKTLQCISCQNGQKHPFFREKMWEKNGVFPGFLPRNSSQQQEQLLGFLNPDTGICQKPPKVEFRCKYDFA